MKILLLEPFFTGSHKQWAEGYRDNSKHDIEIWSLGGHHWKWRMHAGAISFSLKSQERNPPDVIIATDMLDIGTFRGMLSPSWNSVPVVAYFHENQLTYPWSDTDPDRDLKRDRHYAFMNYTSALASQEVWFNSSFHLSSFIDQLPEFLGAFPDEKNLQTVNTIAKRSLVMPLGFDFSSIMSSASAERIPRRIVWNHRWEYDKNPEDFFHLLFELKEEGHPFELVVLGQEFGHSPSIFKRAKDLLPDQIVHWGYASSRKEYLHLLSSCSVAPVTSNQDFFGISAVEAIACGVTPLLPSRLAFPEHIEGEDYFYSTRNELKTKLINHLNTVVAPETLREQVLRYDWKEVAQLYDNRLEELAANSGK